MDYFDDIKIRDNKESLRSCVCPSLNEGWKKEKTMKRRLKELSDISNVQPRFRHTQLIPQTLPKNKQTHT